MIDDKKIKKILEDLYKIDPEFKNYEKKLAKIVKELLLLQPNIKPDVKFVEDLKAMLKIEEKKVNKKEMKSKKEEISKNYFTSFNFLFDLSRSFVIVSVLLLLVVSFSFVKLQKSGIKVAEQKNQLDYLSDFSQTKIVKKGKNGFGSLYSQSGSMLSSEGSSEIARTSSPAYQTMGMGSADSVSAVKISDSMAPLDQTRIMPLPVKYNYIYTGGDFEMFDDEEDVYKRMPLNLSKEFVKNFSGQGLLINSDKFGDLGVSNFNLIEDRDFGYSVYFSLEDGNVSLYKNWKKWPRVEVLCGGWENYQCFEDYRLSFEQILSNEEILSIADEFLANYGVDLKNYGPGEVLNDWLKDYSLAEDKSSYYFPESISVIYPLLVDGKNVYEESGHKSGINVEVDLREKRVSGLYNLFYQNYESSSYETEKNREKIMELVYNGGIYPYYNYFDENMEYDIVDIELGRPSLELVRVWNYDNINMTNEELYVPAYVFPVISQSKPSYYYNKNIVIPAVKDFFKPYGYAQPRTLPYAVDGVEANVESEIVGERVSGSSAGSAELMIKN